uniref:Uncharacterized protein n=1 Tax=Sphaerodactylus townsendi TaxID=933632 RepID=A0ACB8EHN2_9SAUR
MNSEQRKIRNNYLFMKKCVASNPIVPIQQEWLTSMLTLVPQHLMEGKDQEKLVKQLLAEVTTDYELSMKRYMASSFSSEPRPPHPALNPAPVPSGALLPSSCNEAGPGRDVAAVSRSAACPRSALLVVPQARAGHIAAAAGARGCVARPRPAAAGARSCAGARPVKSGEEPPGSPGHPRSRMNGERAASILA